MNGNGFGHQETQRNEANTIHAIIPHNTLAPTLLITVSEA